VAIGDNQQQAPFAPGRHAAMLTRRRLQLAFQQLLQAVEAKGFSEQGSERLRFTQQSGRSSGRRRAEGHDGP
jgi:hypothetical protein